MPDRRPRSVSKPPSSISEATSAREERIRLERASAASVRHARRQSSDREAASESPRWRGARRSASPSRRRPGRRQIGSETRESSIKRSVGGRSGARCWVPGAGCRVPGAGCQGARCRGARCQVLGAGCRVPRCWCRLVPGCRALACPVSLAAFSCAGCVWCFPGTAADGRRRPPRGQRAPAMELLLEVTNGDGPRRRRR